MHRDGKVQTFDKPVQKTNEQVEPYLYDKRPEYFIFGGLVFTRLTSSYLLTFGNCAPLMEKTEKVPKAASTSTLAAKYR